MKRRTRKEKIYAQFRAPAVTQKVEEIEDHSWFLKDISKTLLICAVLTGLLVFLYQRLSI